jgi:hypothetical protein
MGTVQVSTGQHDAPMRSLVGSARQRSGEPALRMLITDRHAGHQAPGARRRLEGRCVRWPCSSRAPTRAGLPCDGLYGPGIYALDLGSPCHGLAKSQRTLALIAPPDEAPPATALWTLTPRSTAASICTPGGVREEGSRPGGGVPRPSTILQAIVVPDSHPGAWCLGASPSFSRAACEPEKTYWRNQNKKPGR